MAENRRRMARLLCVDADHLLVPYQIHSADALVATGPFSERPRCDGLVTATRGLALAVTGADCGMILFADPKARVIGAAHAGWKGALNGVLEATISAMESLARIAPPSSRRSAPPSARRAMRLARNSSSASSRSRKSYADFFAPSPQEPRFQFDLPGFIGMRLRAAGVGAFEDLARDTYAEPEHFFSYRRSVHKGEADYGRQVAAIALA